MTTAFEIYRDAAGEYRWRATAPENGNVLAGSSEGYVRREDAIRNLFRILKAMTVGCTIQGNGQPLCRCGLPEPQHRIGCPQLGVQ